MPYPQKIRPNLTAVPASPRRRCVRSFQTFWLTIPALDAHGAVQSQSLEPPVPKRLPRRERAWTLEPWVTHDLSQGRGYSSSFATVGRMPQAENDITNDEHDKRRAHGRLGSLLRDRNVRGEYHLLLGAGASAEVIGGQRALPMARELAAEPRDQSGVPTTEDDVVDLRAAVRGNRKTARFAPSPFPTNPWR
jgi:hypothetical protein